MELEREIVEAGRKLLTIPSPVEELLTVLDQVEELLAKVDQAPEKSTLEALFPSMKALISEELLGHADMNVQVSVAASLSELTRIIAPNAPYNNERMKEIFKLTVMAIGKLSCDEPDRCYTKAIKILDCVAEVESCLLMLDLNCDSLVVDMFQQFLNTIRSNHPDDVFRKMEHIMTVAIRESEQISRELLSTLLSSVKKENQTVSPLSWKLGENVLKTCAAELRAHLPEVVKSTGLNFSEYSDVVATICRDSRPPATIKEYGVELIGCRVKVWWPLDEQFYEGVVATFDPSEKKHQVLYDDGDQEILNLREERWELLDDASPPKYRKMTAKRKSESSSKQKRTGYSSKRKRTDSSSKRSVAENSKIEGPNSGTNVIKDDTEEVDSKPRDGEQKPTEVDPKLLQEDRQETIVEAETNQAPIHY